MDAGRQSAGDLVWVWDTRTQRGNNQDDAGHMRRAMNDGRPQTSNAQTGRTSGEEVVVAGSVRVRRGVLTVTLRFAQVAVAGAVLTSVDGSG